MTHLIWIIFSYLCGALPLSLWIGRVAGYDILQYGDGNPGATNVLRAAGWPWFILALCADISKAAVPVGLAYQVFGWRGWVMVPIALAPPLGHAYTPFLCWQGGKALAAMFGVWVGLTIWPVPAVLVVSLLVWFGLILRTEVWAVSFTVLMVHLYLILFDPNPYFLLIITLHLLLILWTHRHELNRRPQLRFGTRQTQP